VFANDSKWVVDRPVISISSMHPADGFADAGEPDNNACASAGAPLRML
jgi:hypothetical protein